MHVEHWSTHRPIVQHVSWTYKCSQTFYGLHDFNISINTLRRTFAKPKLNVDKINIIFFCHFSKFIQWIYLVINMINHHTLRYFQQHHNKNNLMIFTREIIHYSTLVELFVMFPQETYIIDLIHKESCSRFLAPIGPSIQPPRIYNLTQSQFNVPNIDISNITLQLKYTIFQRKYLNQSRY